MSDEEAENIIDMLVAFMAARSRRLVEESDGNDEAAAHAHARELSYRRELVARMQAACPSPSRGEGGDRG